MLRNSWAAGQLAASHEGLISIEFAIYTPLPSGSIISMMVAILSKQIWQTTEVFQRELGEEILF
jgi:hypothetical protein